MIRTLGNIVVVVFALAFVAGAARSQGEENVVYHLSIERGPYVSGESIPCRIVIENDTDALRIARRPVSQRIELLARGSDGRNREVSWQGEALDEQLGETVPLQPKCQVSVLVGEFTFVDSVTKPPSLPLGLYSIKATWKTAGGEHTDEVLIRGEEEVYIAEFPFAVKIAGRDLQVLGQLESVRISLENHGDLSVSLLNSFEPVELHFEVVLERQVDKGRKELGPNLVPLRRMKVTPDTSTGWIAIRPGESVRVSLDLEKYVKEEGVYRLQVVYPRKLVLKDAKATPRYTNQNRWASNQIEFQVLTAR